MTPAAIATIILAALAAIQRVVQSITGAPPSVKSDPVQELKDREKQIYGK